MLFGLNQQSILQTDILLNVHNPGLVLLIHVGSKSNFNHCNRCLHKTSFFSLQILIFAEGLKNRENQNKKQKVQTLQRGNFFLFRAFSFAFKSFQRILNEHHSLTKESKCVMVITSSKRRRYICHESLRNQRNVGRKY